MSITKRVAVSGGSVGVPASLGGDQWHGAWANAWGKTWYFGTPSSGGSSAAHPLVNATLRVGETPQKTSRPRIHHYLTLEGDDEGFLLLEGDMQSGNDVLILDGDQAEISVGANFTRRVTLNG